MAAGNKRVPSIKSIRISRSKLDLIQMIFRNLATILLIAAVVQELRKPKESRQWHGRVAWFVPYDFRTPTLGRVKTAIWAPENPSIIVPNVFGVGWTLNIGRLVYLLRTG